VNLRECFEKRLLVRARVSEETIRGTLNLAKHCVERATGIFKIGYFDVSLSLAYQSMLHAARAITFKDGIKERSHLCVILYLKERYRQDPTMLKHLNLLDSYRISRHEIVYRGGEVSEKECLRAIEDAREFLNLSHDILGVKRVN
jgi:uncharacterized protein (UPF0332 family)